MKYLVNLMIVALVICLPLAEKLVPKTMDTGTIKSISETIVDSIPYQNVVVETVEKDVQAVVYQSNVGYKVGEKVVLQRDAQREDLYTISDKARTKPIIQLFILFVITILIVSREAGIRSLAGLFFSFLVIFKFVLPQIVLGSNPITIALVASSIMLIVSYYLTHGVNQKSTIAILGTLAALTITGILATVFARTSSLTGFGAEETAFLLDKLPIESFYNLLLAGFIIGSLGVLDDITISQASIVAELQDANHKLSSYELYTRAMRIGRDHISSLVNTLVLVYAGSALPLLLLFITSDASILHLLNFEIVAEEIVRTLVGSIGLIAAVPLTTMIAAYHWGKNR